MPKYIVLWEWEEAFDKFGFDDGDGMVFTGLVAKYIESLGYETHYDGGFHNTYFGSIKDKFISFGWDAHEIDGHNIEELLNFFKSIRQNNNKKPIALIANTLKGKGVSFMENKVLWHYRCPLGKEYETALKELENI